jgi:hypothetical protein
MATRFGKLRPRYRFALNPFPAVRWSRCPRCEKLMHARKFPLLIAFSDFAMLTLGKTCRYCTPCEFIIAHQHEIEDEIAIFRANHPGHATGEWFVLGTVERDVWETSLRAQVTLDVLREHTSDIRYPMILHDPRPRWVVSAENQSAR